MNLFKAALRALLAMFMPQQCAICGRRLSPGEQQICTTCTMSLPYTRFGARPDNAMERLLVGRFPLCRASAYMFYNSSTETRNLLFALKYRGAQGVGEEMGRRMAAEWQPMGFFEGVDIIVPVPLSRQRQRKRGYNQSLLIAQGISQITGISVDTSLLERIVDNPTQTRLSPSERIENVKGIFSAPKPESLNGRHILLIDDVLTTGATLTACADTLAKSGARLISIATLAVSGTVGKY